MYLLLLLLLSVTLWDVRLSKADRNYCSAGANVLIHEVQTYREDGGNPNWIQLECKFISPRGVISMGLEQDHGVTWSDTTDPNGLYGLASYHGLANPVGRMESNHPSHAVSTDHHTVKKHLVDVTRVFRRPAVMTSRITLDPAEHRQVKCSVHTADNQRCSDTFNIPQPGQTSPVARDFDPDEETWTCPPRAAIVITELPGAVTSPKFECTFTYPGGVISQRSRSDHRLKWAEHSVNSDGEPKLRQLIFYRGLQNPTGVIDHTHEDVTLYDENITQVDVDLTEVFDSPRVLKSTITFTPTLPNRDIRCIVFTADHHRCVAEFIVPR